MIGVEKKVEIDGMDKVDSKVVFEVPEEEEEVEEAEEEAEDEDAATIIRMILTQLEAFREGITTPLQVLVEVPKSVQIGKNQKFKT